MSKVQNAPGLGYEDIYEPFKCGPFIYSQNIFSIILETICVVGPTKPESTAI